MNIFRLLIHPLLQPILLQLDPSRHGLVFPKRLHGDEGTTPSDGTRDMPTRPLTDELLDGIVGIDVHAILIADGFLEQRQGDGAFEGLDFLADDQVVVFFLVGVGIGGKPGGWGRLILVLDVPDSSFKVEVFGNVAVLFSGGFASVQGISLLDSINVDVVQNVLSLEGWTVRMYRCVWLATDFDEGGHVVN